MILLPVTGRCTCQPGIADSTDRGSQFQFWLCLIDRLQLFLYFSAASSDTDLAALQVLATEINDLSYFTIQIQSRIFKLSPSTTIAQNI